jgi:hypothetical protein
LKIFQMKLFMTYSSFLMVIIFMKDFLILIYDFEIFVYIQIFESRPIFHFYQNQNLIVITHTLSNQINIELNHFIDSIHSVLIISLHQQKIFQNVLHFNHLFLTRLKHNVWKIFSIVRCVYRIFFH